LAIVQGNKKRRFSSDVLLGKMIAADEFYLEMIQSYCFWGTEHLYDTVMKERE
jgi:hypothetical protein